MHLRFTLAVVLSLFAQAALTASTAYNFASPTLSTNVGGATFDSGGANPTYTSGVWTENFTGTNTGTSEQIVCTVGIGLTAAQQANTCGNPGPGSAAHIGVATNVNPVNNAVVGQPLNSAALPAGTNFYAEDDGDPTYGAPISTQMTGLTVGATYQLSFWQASNEEDGNDKAYSDTWEVFVMPGASAGEYICPTGICTTAVDPGGIQPVFTSAAMTNPGNAETPWQLQTFNFVATQANEILEFVTDAVGTAGFQPPILDLAAVTTTQVVAPEPGTWVLMVLGIGLVFGASKLRRKRAHLG
jgi:hypothetical protein